MCLLLQNAAAKRKRRDPTSFVRMNFWKGVPEQKLSPLQLEKLGKVSGWQVSDD